MVTAKIAATIQNSGPRRIRCARVRGGFFAAFLPEVLALTEADFFTGFLALGNLNLLMNTCALLIQR